MGAFVWVNFCGDLLVGCCLSVRELLEGIVGGWDGFEGSH